MEFRYEGNSLKSGVYQIRNITNGKVYIGSAKEFKSRWKAHEKSLLKGKHKNKYLQNAFNKDGTDTFRFEVLEVVDGTKEDRFAREQFYINKYISCWDQCYNLNKKATGKDHTEETKDKLSKLNTGENHPQYGRRGKSHHNFGKIPWNKGKKGVQAAWNKGKTWSESAKKNMSIAQNLRYLEKPVSKETKQKRSESMKKWYASEAGLLERAKRSEKFKNSNPMKIEEHKEKMKESRLNKGSIL